MRRLSRVIGTESGCTVAWRRATAVTVAPLLLLRHVYRACAVNVAQIAAILRKRIIAESVINQSDCLRIVYAPFHALILAILTTVDVGIDLPRRPLAMDYLQRSIVVADAMNCIEIHTCAPATPITASKNANRLIFCSALNNQ